MEKVMKRWEAVFEKVSRPKIIKYEGDKKMEQINITELYQFGGALEATRKIILNSGETRYNNLKTEAKLRILEVFETFIKNCVQGANSLTFAVPVYKNSKISSLVVNFSTGEEAPENERGELVRHASCYVSTVGIECDTFSITIDEIDNFLEYFEDLGVYQKAV